MKKKVLLLIIIALVSCQQLRANIYYVSTTGDDATGNGTSARPWRTLKFAASRVPANQGHTIQISAGTFVESGLIEIPPGVSVTGAGKGSTILRAASAFYYNPAAPGYATNKFLVSLKASSLINGNQQLRNFTIDGDSKKLHGGIYVRYRSNVTIDNVKVQNTNFTGIWLWDVKDAKITNTDLINCSWGSTGYCSGALNLGNLERVDISRLNVDEGVGYGIKAIGPSGYNDITELKIHDSRVSVHPYGLWNNGTAPNIAIELWQVNLVRCEIYNTYVDNTISLVNSNANPSTGVRTIRVHHNTIDIQTRAQGAGYGMELTLHDAEVDHNYFLKGRYGIVNWDNPMKNWEIHHNVFYGLEGVYPGDILRSQWSGLHNVNFYNNTIEFAGTKTMNVVGIYGGTSENLNLFNNLFINNNSSYSYYPNSLVHRENGAVLNSLSVKNNFFDRLPVGSVAGNYSGNITGDPKISKAGNRPDPYYKPVTGSPLIDSGLKLILSLLEPAPDIGAYEFTSGVVNQSPQVALTNPMNNSTLVSGSSILLSANASDADGTISKVEFYVGAEKIGEDLNSPYSLEWNIAAAGNYSLTAKATDNQGAAATSGTIAITVTPNQTPTAVITSPADNAMFTAGSTIAISASATDPEGVIQKVEFFNGAVKLGEDLAQPYSYTWTNAGAGIYSLTVRVTDGAGNTNTSAPIRITVGEASIRLGLFAPDALLGGTMKLTSDITASKGSYFAVPSGYGTNHVIPPPSYAQFYFHLPKTDSYVIWVRMKSPATNHQGYHVYDGKGHWTSWLAGVHTDWTWVKITNAYTREVATFPFTSGANFFRMAWFHDNVPVDRILITNDHHYIPTDMTEPPPSQEGGQSVARSTVSSPEEQVETNDETVADGPLAVYPNPVKDVLTISLVSESSQDARISIKNATSFESREMNVALIPGRNNIDVNMGDQQRGMYLIDITASDGKRFVRKVIVTD